LPTFAIGARASSIAVAVELHIIEHAAGARIGDLEDRVFDALEFGPDMLTEHTELSDPLVQLPVELSLDVGLVAAVVIVVGVALGLRVDLALGEALTL
jgi:hypothetical protein